jgi:hypothetical protein
MIVVGLKVFLPHQRRRDFRELGTMIGWQGDARGCHRTA